MAAVPAPLNTQHGCPSGLGPPADGPRLADPSPFVRREKDGRDSLELLVKGAHCAGCIRKIEGAVRALPGVENTRLNLTTGRLFASWRPGALAPRAIVETVGRLGYEALPFDPEASRHSKDETGRDLLIRLAVAGFAMMNIMMFSVPVWSGVGEMGEGARGLMHWVSALIALPACLYAAQPFFRSAAAALKQRRANMDVPISLGVILALSISVYETASGGPHAYFDGASMLLFFLLIGRYLDHRLRHEARSAAQDLLALQAVTAQRLDPDGVVRAVALRDVAPGDRLHLAPGDRVPVDGVIEQGASEFDKAILTGETAPAPAGAGDAIPAGAVNLTRPLIMRATRAAAESTVAELARLIEAGEQARARRMRIADKAASLYVPVVHTLAALTFIGWLAAPPLLRAWGYDIADLGLRGALLNAVAVLIITCPCALGLAVPAVQIVATARLFRRGVLVKSGDALERLAQADYVVLDKTGTLTLGRPALVGAVDAAALREAASLARASHHPLARALVEAAGPGRPAAEVIEHPGQGLEASLAGAPARLGRRAFAAPEAGDDGAHAGPELWFKHGEAAPIRFRFEDKLRPDAAAAVAAFRARGIDVELLSGDRPEAVEAAARAAGIATWRASVSPQDKIARLAALAAAGRRPLMIGDGLNDAAALAAAHVSAAPGAAIGASQAAADLVFQGERLSPIVEALDVARKAERRVIENLGFSALYNLIAAPIAIFGFVTPFIAAFAMSSSSLVVTLNALRLREKGRSQ
ncbi:MAG: heavy metal translocating P-type ATPase [Hydrogenophilaceae bacterium]|nr:heavy metal translocating P-type ATPase [Hydrogenophilaceae bacterium]